MPRPTIPLMQPAPNPLLSPLVSVVPLSYNRPACLQEALASLLIQSYEHLEITVVDKSKLGERGDTNMRSLDLMEACAINASRSG